LTLLHLTTAAATVLLLLLLQDQRQPVHEVEALRQKQLAQLRALGPDHPTQLLAEYRQAAMDFDCYKVRLGMQHSAVFGHGLFTDCLRWQPASAVQAGSHDL
jgi:hypothetical protein